MNVMEFYSLYLFTLLGGFSGSSAVKEICPQYRNHWRLGFEPWVSEIPWRRTWQPHQYSCLENPMDRGARWATVHRVRKSGHDRSNLTHTRAEIGRLLWYAGTYLRVSKVKKKQKQNPSKQTRTKRPQPCGGHSCGISCFS